MPKLKSKILKVRGGKDKPWTNIPAIGSSGGGTAYVPIASKESPGIVAVGENLKISETGALSVDTTDVAEEDNTKPITSSGVNTIVGNIGAILETI